ncbi:hypothetical protein CRM22_010761 [Opisthorchis felineus]|uniref:non-specific serine/threonine protein kinase n=1 Tax=Opisthorchis felineus TaxID=147828 RepID=A0A4S2KMB2_OPIFE|nr:hypothetical protein CRM22_010761 [Opisthorchis felineus]
MHERSHTIHTKQSFLPESMTHEFIRCHYYTVKLLDKWGTKLVRWKKHQSKENQCFSRDLCVVKPFAVGECNSDEQGKLLEKLRILVGLRHPFLLQYFSCFLEKEHITILCEYCEGGSLQSYLKNLNENGRHMEEHQVGVWAVQLIMALNFLHKNGLLHGDVKSSNIFLKNGHVKLCGLERCRLPATTSKIYDPFSKTLYHLSPEVWKEGIYTHKADVWSLGLVIYEMCSQEHALSGTGLIRVLWQSIQQSCPRLPPPYSDELQHLIDAMLTKDPETRPNTSELFHYPFLMHQLFDMNRRLKLANIEISGMPLREQLEELRKIWEAPVDSTNSQGDELIEIQSDNTHLEDDNSMLHLEGLSEVVKSDTTEVDDAVSESSVTQESRTDTNASNNGSEKEQVLRYPKETETFLPWREKQRYQLPEEKMLQELRSLAQAVLQTKTDVDEPEDLVWPAPTAIYEKISHTDNVPLKEYTIQKIQQMRRSYSEEPSAPYLNKRTQVENAQGEITKEVREEQPKVPEYWKLYTENWITEQSSKSTGGTNGALQPVLETTEGKEQPEFVQQYQLSRSRTAPADPNRQTLMTVTNKPITFCEPQLIDINISNVTILKQGKQPEPTRSNVIPSLVSGDDKPEEHILFPGDLEETRTAEEMHISLEESSNSPCGDTVAEYQVSSQPKIPKLRFDVKWIDAANLRNLCLSKLGPELFEKAYNFLHNKRIDEQNTAGELTIVNGLRTLLKEPSVGFAVDQLILLEHVRNL